MILAPVAVGRSIKNAAVSSFDVRDQATLYGFVPKQESRLDKVIEVDDPSGSYLINFEPMGYYDTKLPARMLRYRGDIWEYTLTKGKGTPTIRQIVIFFYPEHDCKNHLLTDYWGEAIMLRYTYLVIQIWMESRQKVIINNNHIKIKHNYSKYTEDYHPTKQEEAFQIKY